MEIRPQSKPAQVDSGPKIIRVRGVVVSEAVENRRLKWTGSAYAVTPDVIEFFPDSGTIAHELEEDEEAMCVWMPAAARWEEFPGGGTADFIIGQTTATVADTDATFTIDNIFCVSGTDPRTDPEDAAETLSVKNSLGLELDNNHKVFAYKNKAGAWETWADTSGAGVPAEFYMTIKGVLGGSEGDAITASTSTFTISSLALVNGTEVPGSLTVTNNPPLHAPPGATIYARYNLLVGSGDTDHWDTASSKNFLYMVKGVGGYSQSSLQLIANEGDDNPEWVTPDSYSSTEIQYLGHGIGDDSYSLQWIDRTESVLAIIKGTVPASSGINTSGSLSGSSALVAVVGTLAAVYDADEFTTGALIVTLDDGDIVPVIEGASIRVLPVLNPSLSIFIGEGQGVLVQGHVVGGHFVPSTSEIRTRYGYDPDLGNLVMVQPDADGEETVVSGWSDNDKSLGSDTTGDAEWQDDGDCD